MIIALHNVFTRHISETHLWIVSLNVPELELNWYDTEKISQRKRESHLTPPLPAWEVETQFPG